MGEGESSFAFGSQQHYSLGRLQSEMRKEYKKSTFDRRATFPR